MAGEMTQLAKTKIGQAIKDNNYLELKWLIENGEDIHFKDRKGNTFLHYVCSMYRPDCFHILTATKLDINAQNKFGYTPLHVTTFKKNCLHVYDVMANGADLHLKDQWGKTSYDMAAENAYWRQAYEKYKPGMFTAVQDHDVKRVKELLQCWFKVDSYKNGQTLRQFAAAHKFHDIVLILDQHKATMNVVYGVKERNYEKVRMALKKSWCKVNFLNMSLNKPHILQHALKMKDFELVKMLCEAGADINLRVLVNEYFWGPLYFEAINNHTPQNIMMTVLKSGANFRLKDERGRTGIVYALDKTNGCLPLEIFNFLLKNGSYLADRDNTGVTVRDVASFARRSDVRDLIDKFYVKIIRDSDIEKLEQLACDGYDNMLHEFNYRDAFIYAAGNTTDEAGKFVTWLPKFLSLMKSLQQSVEEEACGFIQRLFEDCDRPKLLANCRDMGWRTPLMLATLHARDDIVRYILLTEMCDINLQDCQGRTALHYSYMLDVDGKNIRKYLLHAGVDTSIKDNKNKLPSDYEDIPNKDEWLDKEINAEYGMPREIMCMKKYEELRRIIKGKKKGLQAFSKALKNCKYPVADFPIILSPLVQDYRDLIFLAVDYGKQDIAERLADLDADLKRKEKYIFRTEEQEQIEIYMTVIERAANLNMTELLSVLQKIKEKRLLKREAKVQKETATKIETNPNTRALIWT
ncbi:putative ankyrin repeat protein RF_0381 [Mytilus trossulus]|uniref:putative ankyrin repeat protein RF_0381 n=1 Tax=Mytilus trossulus TaxID=6551 RepID=UPI003005E643